MIQSLVNMEETFPDAYMDEASAYSVHSNRVILGKADHDVWTKNFKIRVTSKHTGRKFDINLNCKTEYSGQDAGGGGTPS